MDWIFMFVMKMEERLEKEEVDVKEEVFEGGKV